MGCHIGFNESSIYDWIKTNNLKNVYAYDRGRSKWIPFDERIELLTEDNYVP